MYLCIRFGKNEHTHAQEQSIAKVLVDKELGEDSVIKQFFTTASDGKPYNTYFQLVLEEDDPINELEKLKLE